MSLLCGSSLAIAFAYLFVQFRLTLGWRSIPTVDPAPNDDAAEPLVTVLVPMRNEADAIRNLINCLLVQDHRSFEIICLDNHSTDQSAKIVEQIQDDRVRVVRLAEHLPEGSTFKKEAIEFGVELAEGDVILCTDADSIVPSTWISTMMGNLTNSKADYIVGPIKMISQRRSFLTDFQALDYCGLLVLTGGGLHSGSLVSSFGPNHGYLKSSFNAVGGYAGNREFRSGDDIFLAQKMVMSGRSVSFVKDHRATVSSLACTDWRSFWSQRLRWVSKVPSLRHLPSLIIAAIPLLLSVSLFALLVEAFFNPRNWSCVLIVYLIKVCADTMVLKHGTSFTGQTFTTVTWVASHLFHPVYLWFTGLGSLFVRPKWKGRKI